MERGLNSTSKVAIVGGGPAGCFCAYFLQNDFDVTVFDRREPLKTILPTGGGRCNLSYAEYNFKELAQQYPRGEKFLYSVFSKFSVSDTLEIFDCMGIKTYIQEDNRIFPVSNSSKDFRERFLKALNNVKFVRKNVKTIDFENYDYVVVAIGGHSLFDLIPEHKIIEPKPALTGLKTALKYPQGVSLKNVKSYGFCDDLIFTHEGVSGPLIYKISSVMARTNFPYKINLNLCEDFDIQSELNLNPHKSIKNLISNYVPKSMSDYILNMLNINDEIKCCMINAKMRDAILNCLHNFEIEVVAPSSGGEVVTSGGVCLDEVNPKTMQSKLNPKLYFCGEVLDIDGFCGGFNLQNCWSTAYVAAEAIKVAKNA